MCETHGCVAFSNGEIIYLMKCKPVLVKITKKDTCFNELPVLYQNQSYFMSPKSHILQRYGTEIICNIRFPSAYFIEGEWLGLNPHLTEIKTPQTLHPETKFTWKYKSLEYLISAGIYNQDVMQALQKHLMFAQEVTAIQNNIVRQTLGYEVSNQLNLHRLIDPTVISDMVEDKLHKMWGWFTYFGSLMSGVLGIIFMIKIITLIINACMNIQLLYNTFGWSIRLLGGLFNNITHYFMHQNHQQQYNNVVDLYNVKVKTPNPPNTQINFRSLLYPDLNQQNIE
ncbi:uncharacterized protein LOC126898647 [Daktulosphaira vitifoliae]|uniref:uncharacterized protein LOC126898647 n=1 Tax=Daktulosphaira vitifoliae TaxID=58002 RepID=UPI0021AAAAEB|nr:uncharacterized protein LOC126898647 [Daktulosphaira vitifoliae]